MGFEARRVAGPMAEFVERIWVCSNAPGPWRLERVLPSGRAQMVVNLKEDETRSYLDNRVVSQPGTVISGIGTRFEVIDTAEQEEVAGVVFRPGGTMGFSGFPRRCFAMRVFRWRRCGERGPWGGCGIDCSRRGAEQRG